MRNHGYARRTDLYLRSAHPELETEIYRIDENNFSIYCKGEIEEFDKLKEEFNYSIRLVSSCTELVKTKPKEFLEIIPNISDKDISKNFEGIPMSKAILLNLLKSKFKDVNFTKIEDSNGIVDIYFAINYKDNVKNNELLKKNSLQKSINKFLEGLRKPVEFRVIEENQISVVEDESPQLFNPVQFIYASNIRDDKNGEYTLRDEALWFDNVDKIFEGSFKKEDLFFYNPAEYACYVDYSIFGNIDIRNYLFLFQTTYLTPPFKKDINKWLKENKISREDFLYLVHKNRIKIILTQPETRYDKNFINAVYEANPKAVITRRAVSCLQQIDIVGLSDNYLLNEVSIVKELKHLCNIVNNKTNLKSTQLYDILVWPIRARRNSFENLTNSGLFGTSSFGVNLAIENEISRQLNKDLSFEFTINSPNIHLASSLNAVYFPYVTKEGYSDYIYSNIMGELLSFYKNSTINNIKSYIDNKNEINSGILPISLIDLIETNEFISIIELEKILSKDYIYPKSKRLIESLSELSLEEREKKIQFYNHEVDNIFNKRNKNKNVIDLATNILVDGAGAISGIPVLGSLYSLTKISGNELSKVFPKIKTILSKIEEAFHGDTDKSNIHYLSKISSVARLKKKL